MKIIKRILAIILVLALSLSLAGCYNQDITWVAKDGDDEIPVGVYIYYLSLALDTAAGKVPDTDELMKATIDGKSAEDFIRDQALTYLKSYVWIDRKIKELGLELTDGEKNNATEGTSYMWAYYGTSFTEMGVSQSSLNLAYSQYNTKYKKVFDYYYGEGGEFEIPKDTLKENYSNSNYSYAYMYDLLMTTDENGTSAEMTDEELASLTATFDSYKNKVETGYMTLEEAANEYAMANELTESQYIEDISDLMYQYYPTNFVENLETLEEGKCTVFESGTNLVLLQKFPIENAFEDAYAVGSTRLNMLLDLKSDEFTDYVYTKAAEEVTDININSAAIKSVKVSDFINDNTKMGTLATGTEEETE